MEQRPAARPVPAKIRQFRSSVILIAEITLRAKERRHDRLRRHNVRSGDPRHLEEREL